MARGTPALSQLRLGIDRSAIRFLHAADLHLDSPLRGLARYEGAPLEEMRQACRRAFDRLVEVAETEEVDLVLLAGDIFDGDWRDYNTGLYFASRLHRLVDAGIDVVMVRGNHDAQSRITKGLRLPSRVHDLSTDRPCTILLERLGVAVHGQGYREANVETDLSAGYPPPIPGLFNIGLLHTALEGRDGHASYAPTNAARLAAKGYEYWALGHVHQREIVSRDPWIVFPGNLQGRHAKETGQKGASLVAVEDRQVRSVEARALDVVRWATVTVDAAEHPDLEAVLSAVEGSLLRASARAEGRTLAVRLRVVGATSAQPALVARQGAFEAEVRRIGTSLAGGPVFVEKVELDTRAAFPLEQLIATPGPLGELISALDKDHGDPELRAALLAEIRELRARLGDRLFADERGQNEEDAAIVERLLPRIKERVLPLLLSEELLR